jgi:hypothetical protein
MSKEFDFGNEPCKQNEVRSKQQVLQAFEFNPHKIENLIHTDPYKKYNQPHRHSVALRLSFHYHGNYFENSATVAINGRRI